MENQDNNVTNPTESSENIVNFNKNTTNINTININVDFLKQLRQLIEVTNDRIKWKTSELLPVGIIIKQLDDLLKDKSLKIQKGHVKVINKKFSNKEIIKNSFEWAPSNYRNFISHSPEQSKEHALMDKSEKIVTR